jgi:hypothetical protein
MVSARIQPIEYQLSNVGSNFSNYSFFSLSENNFDIKMHDGCFHKVQGCDGGPTSAKYSRLALQ